MDIDLSILVEQLAAAPPGVAVSAEDVNAYLLEHLLTPLMGGEDLRYGDIDFTQFEADDLRALAFHYDEIETVAQGIGITVRGLLEAKPAFCPSRAFC